MRELHFTLVKDQNHITVTEGSSICFFFAVNQANLSRRLKQFYFMFYFSVGYDKNKLNFSI